MASRNSFTALIRGVEGWTNSPEEYAKEAENWVQERMRSGRKLRNRLPLWGELEIRLLEVVRYVERIVIPQNAISQRGYVKEIWVPGFEDEIRIDGKTCRRVFPVQDYPIHYSKTLVHVYYHDALPLLLSPHTRKIKIVLYLQDG